MRTSSPHFSLAFATIAGLALLIQPTFAGLFGSRFAPPPEDRDTIVLAQIHLDELMLGPGKIDGDMGEFTKQAAALFNQKHRIDDPANWWRLLRDAERRVKSAYTYYTIQDADLNFVGDLPTEPAEQQNVEYLSYRRILEFVSERFHTDEKFLREINPNVNVDNLLPGQQLLVPNVSPFRIESIPTHARYEADEKLSSRTVYVDTKSRVVKIYDKGVLLANFPITPGADEFIPYGDWSVQVMVSTPEFRWDEKMLKEGERGADDTAFQLPPGPNSPVGILWAGLDKSGIGLHGTSSPHTIGRSRSAGCIRLANWDAIRLPGLLRPGAKVLVR
ncbi:MAG: lipoprotein-anchoring transpeptidase ErfK/SrfK [Verrucomicrobiales bacterium]|jgi:lipoprotein-anchoring transpeptidase ErfK/SrfK